MYKIIKKRMLAENAVEFTIEAPLVAKHAKEGQFVIVRCGKDGERIPFTLCDFDKEKGTITLLIQTVGYSTYTMKELNEGDSFTDVVGPLGRPTELGEFKNLVLVGGGIGTAVIYPQAKKLLKENRNVDVIVGARDKSLIMYEEEFKNNSSNLYISTNDGSYGEKGFVTDVLKRLIDEGKNYDLVFAVGPLPMMKAVCNLTREYNIRTIVSMNNIMIDGTGMCGGCRLTVNGETKYACVDGPEFDGHLIDFDETIKRNSAYKEDEEKQMCRLTGEKR